MKVKDFIEALQKCDPEKEVIRSHYDGVEQWDELAKIKETDNYVHIE